MNITEQITSLLKQSIDNNTIFNFVYIYIKLTKKYVSYSSNKLTDYCYRINVKDYMNGSECTLCDIGYLTYPVNNSDFSVSLCKLMYYDYRDITAKDGYFRIPIELYIQNNKLGVCYSNGTMLNVFGDSVQEIVDNLNTMCDNNPNFRLHLNEEFTNLINKD